MFTEELRTNTKKVLDKIYMFLGIVPGYYPKDLNKKYNTGGVSRAINIIPLIQKIYPFRNLWKLLPLAFRKELYLWFITEFNVSKDKSEPHIPINFRYELASFFRKYVLLLKYLLGTSVPWKEF